MFFSKNWHKECIYQMVRKLGDQLICGGSIYVDTEIRKNKTKERWSDFSYAINTEAIWPLDA
jgi:hypothetical protein